MVLTYINMNLPQVYTCSTSWTLLPPHTIPLGRPSAPAPRIQYRASNLNWRLISHTILYMIQCHSPKLSHPLPLLQTSPKTMFCLLSGHPRTQSCGHIKLTITFHYTFIGTFKIMIYLYCLLLQLLRLCKKLSQDMWLKTIATYFILICNLGRCWQGEPLSTPLWCQL